ncbi:MAG TPA: aldehyde dehydrogenase family protein, partial [Rhizorhapis sp.]|nr:aldehyde dehydrogenase family protein [Rhizorhapis sp.]
IIEIDSIADLTREVFGPVLHVICFRRENLDELIAAINATGYGLTFGLHTRLDETMAHVTARIRAGNIYVNRNIIGAVVGVQPFGGRGLSGTGPKAGGPLYLSRLVAAPPALEAPRQPRLALLDAFGDWLASQGDAAAAATARRYGEQTAVGTEMELPGPVGERNLYALRPLGSILMLPETHDGLLEQMAAVLASGNRGCVKGMHLPKDLPPSIAAVFAPHDPASTAAALVDGDDAKVLELLASLAASEGPIIPVHRADSEQPLAYPVNLLLEEVATSINTTAAGGNASLMMIG